MLLPVYVGTECNDQKKASSLSSAHPRTFAAKASDSGFSPSGGTKLLGK